MSRLDDVTKGQWIFTDGAVYAEQDGGTSRVRILLADRNTSQTAPWERDANLFLAQFSPEMLAMLSTAESALFYAKTEGTFDTESTKTDVRNAHSGVRALLEKILKSAQ